MSASLRKFFPGICLVAATIAFSFYLYKTTIYKPLNLYLLSENKVSYDTLQQHIQLHVFSPLGKELAYDKQKIFTGISNDYAYIGKVTVDISPVFYQHFQPILITAGKDSSRLERNNFTGTGSIYSATVKIENKGVIAKLFSIIRWGPISWTLEYIIWKYLKKILLFIAIVTGVIIGIFLFIVILFWVVFYLKKLTAQTRSVFFTLFKSVHNLAGAIAGFTALFFKTIRVSLKRANMFLQNLLKICRHHRYLLFWISAAIGCTIVQIAAYIYFKHYGALRHVFAIALSFYGFFITLIFIAHYYFKKATVTLMLLSVIISLGIMDGVLNLLCLNKSILEQRSGYYLTQYKPLITDWYYTRQKGSEYCLCNLEYAFQRKANNEGLADSTFMVQKKPAEIRIMGLGDSFTEGDGADADSTYLKTTERIFRKQYPDNPLRFLNAGMCGSDVIFEYTLLSERLLKYKPDMVVVALNNSDVNDIFVRGGFERYLPNGTVQFRKGPRWEFLYAQNHVFRLAIKALMGVDDLLLIPEKKRQQLIPESMEIIKQAIVKFKQLADKNGFKFVLIVHPFKNEWEEKKYWCLMNEELQKTCNDYNIEMLDALAYYTQQKNIPQNSIGDYYWKIDGHHNAKGYELLGEAAAYKLQQVLTGDSLLFSPKTQRQ